MKINIPSLWKFIENEEKKIMMRVGRVEKWFAWYPVRINDDSIVWLDFVNRELTTWIGYMTVNTCCHKFAYDYFELPKGTK